LLFPYNFLIEIFYLSNLVPILLIVTYFIWNNFLIWNFWLLILFKISVFQLIFHYTTKYQKIIYFSGIHFKKKNYFPANKREKITFLSILLLLIATNFFMAVIEKLKRQSP
jgi:hypothetical protein